MKRMKLFNLTLPVLIVSSAVAFAPQQYDRRILSTSTTTTASINHQIKTQTAPTFQQTKHHHASISSSKSSSSSTTTTSLSFSMEDLIYSAQSTASDLASTSLTSTTSLTSLSILYIAGLLTSFSPCSLGLLPLTVSYISNAAGEREDQAVLLPTVAFASGLGVVFCALGLSASLLGGVFGGGASSSSSSGGGDDFLGTVTLAIFSSGVAIAMGLQLLDLIELPLPSFQVFSDALENTSMEEDTMSNEIDFDDDGNMIVVEKEKNKEDYDGASALFRTFLLGGSSALVASPCATPVLTSILAFVASNRDPTYGTILLFTYTIGYSTPLLLVGATGGKALANAKASVLTDKDSFVAKIGRLVNPITASILIFYGTNGILNTFGGDPSLAGLTILE